MDLRLTGRVALVTGAGNGVGRACARALAAQGAAVVVNDPGISEFARGESPSAVDTVVAVIRSAGGSAVPSYDSVATDEGVQAAVATAEDAFGPVDIVVGCAGAILPGDLSASSEDCQHLIDLYLSQKFWLTRATLPGMAKRGWGRFISTTSDFAGAMGGVISLTKAIANDYASRGVTANCLASGATTRLPQVVVPQFEQAFERGTITKEMWEALKAGPGPANHVAPIVSWLCSDAAAAVNGQVFSSGGSRVSVWSSYQEQRTIYRGDPFTSARSLLEEFDEFVPGS